MNRYLILLAVSAAILGAAPVDAQTYSLVAPDGTIYLTNVPTQPAYRIASFIEPAVLESSGEHRAYSRDIHEAAARYAVPERLIWAVIRAESGFDPRAVSRKGARGLMQLMPETAAILRVRDCFDPRENIDAGTRHLRAMIERFPRDLRLAVAAYNAGDKVVARYGRVPPYPETQEYVTRVLRFYGAPVKLVELPRGVHQFIERDGTIVYTNIRPANRPLRTGG
jgi:soluble lytic murein transglycosylase